MKKLCLNEQEAMLLHAAATLLFNSDRVPNHTDRQTLAYLIVKLGRQS